MKTCFRLGVITCCLLFLILPPRVVGQTTTETRADVPLLVKGNNAFAVDLYVQMRQEKDNKEKNLFASPYSISTALAMTYAGARGESALQMAKVLHFGLDPKRLHSACAELTRELNGHGLPRDYQLAVANSLWGQDGMPILDEFTRQIKTHYGTRVRRVDFVDPNQREVSRRTINRWVEERTNDKIKNLVQKDDVDKFTRLILVNAIYFKAAWETPFKPSLTYKDVPFHVSAEKSVKAALMHQTKQVGYFDGGSYQAVELPYEGRELAMVVLLPKEKDGLAKLEESLTTAKLEACLTGLKPREVSVALPKFKFTSRFHLQKTLKSMGMPLPCTPFEADFSGMTGDKSLYIDKVIHKAFVGIDEEGTEAAAATAVIMAVPPGNIGNRPIDFRADHPFLFLIHDTRTGSILFLGRMIDPTRAE